MTADVVIAEPEPVEETFEMPTFIPAPKIVEAAGNKPKRIEEYVGRLNSGTASVSVARMVSPAGWVEPGQTPEFDEYTLVLKGTLHVKTREGEINVAAGQAIITHGGEWIQYSTPGPEGAEYVAVCLPAFSPGTVHRDH
jgi:quercetin dioxygenase-like cupin family protein